MAGLVSTSRQRLTALFCHYCGHEGAIMTLDQWTSMVSDFVRVLDGRGRLSAERERDVAKFARFLGVHVTDDKTAQLNLEIFVHFFETRYESVFAMADESELPRLPSPVADTGLLVKIKDLHRQAGPAAAADSSARVHWAEPTFEFGGAAAAAAVESLTENESYKSG